MHDDNFNQVWNRYDHPSPNYSVIAADTLRDLVTLTFDLLTLDSGHAWRVMCSISPPGLKILRLFVLDLMNYDVCHRPSLTIRLEPLRMRRITWTVHSGQIFPHIWNPCPDLSITLQLIWLYDRQNSEIVHGRVLKDTIISAHVPNHVTWQ